MHPTYFFLSSLFGLHIEFYRYSLFIYYANLSFFHLSLYLHWPHGNIEKKLEIEIVLVRKCHRVVIKLILFDKKFASILNSTTPFTYFAAHGVRKNRYTFVTGYRWSVDSNINFESEQRVHTDDKMTRDRGKRERQGEETENTKTRG